MELLLGSIVAGMDWSLHKLDARLSSDVEASYHNMQKVCAQLSFDQRTKLDTKILDETLIVYGTNLLESCPQCGNLDKILNAAFYSS